MTDDEDNIDFSLLEESPVKQSPRVNDPGAAEVEFDASSIMEVMGLQQEGDDINLAKPWMKLHKFELVKQVGRLREIIDEGIKVGRVALDLETEGFDNRIEYDDAGKPYTRHRIVGYCLGIDGAGYYVPVRHKEDPMYRSDSPNIDDVKGAELEITRLCQASQPTLTEEGKQVDPLSSKSWVEGGAPKVVIEFWYSKFDQEFLYPITGIDWWHPESFDDGLLANYTRYTDDDHGLKENALTKIPPVEVDGEKCRYEMIKFDDLFPKGMTSNEKKFANLFPETEGNGWNTVLYGCSDGICTNLLCAKLVPFIMKNPLLANTYRLEKQVTQAVRILERQRVLIDKNAIIELLEEAEREFQEYERKIVAMAEAKGFPHFNPGSSSQLADFLFTPQGLDLNPKPEQTAEGQYKTDEKTIERFVEELSNPPEVLLWIIKYRQISKVKGTYLVNLANNTDERNQLRLNFKQTGAATGRFTAPKGDADHGFAGVPIQGIPARDDPKKPKVAHSMRRLFIARPDYIYVKVDYASQELRIAANVSGERKWIAEYEKEATTGEPADLHYLTAAAFYPGLTKDAPDFKLKRNAGKCVHPDTILDTDVGYRRFRDVAHFPERPDTFLDLPPECRTVDGSKVVATYNGGVKPLVHVVSRKGIVTCTTEHRFMLEDGELVRAGALQKGMALSPAELPTMPPVGSSGIRTFKLWKGVPSASYKAGPKEAYFAGLFLGDGSVNASGCRLIHGDVAKLDAFEESYQTWQDSLFETCTELGFEPTREDEALYLGSRVVVKYLEALELVTNRPNTTNGRMKNLRVPRWVIEGGQETFLPFLGGLIDTDGSVAHQQKTIEYTTKDFVFAGQIAALAQACGLQLSAEATYNKTYQRYYARLRFSVESSWELRKHLRYGGKISRLGEPVNTSKMADVNDILAVIPAGEGPCLDITMGTKEHLYRANGLLTHNTANFALVYGGGVGAVQRATGCDKHEGARLKQAFDDSVPQFSAWVKKQHALVKEKKGVYTAFRRFIAIPDAGITPKQVQERALRQKNPKELSEKDAWKEAKKIQAACERKSTNFPIQGCLRSTALVQTRLGQKPIGLLASTEDVFEAWIGDQWAPAVAKDMGSCELAEVLLKDGTLIECDTRHKLLVVTANGYEWVEYQDLEPGMAIATSLCEPLEFTAAPALPAFESRKKSVRRPALAPTQEDALWYWLGRYMGDGWLDSRGGLIFCFGDHEKLDIEKCRAFWEELGLNPSVSTATHQPHNKESIRHRVEVWSVDLYDWLLKLGLQEGKTAHTKRLPERIFSESLEHRKSFLVGFMDSDGHKPKLPIKIDGVWEQDKKGNPYSLHLCQRPLLVDVKRLLRTVGVESIIRGPYRSGEDKEGGVTTSYRLDIQRRMFEQNVCGNPARLPIFHDMNAPEFLVDEFLDLGPFERASFQGNESAYNLYLRLKTDGQVSVYTLKYLCQLLGVGLKSPIYGYKRLESKKALGQEEHTYTLSVAHSLHRFESDGVITKNSGADILKISLVMLYKELVLRGWLREYGGDDSVRLVMTVHDEVVFEIREDRVADAVPVILKIMEYPSVIAKWKVPLVAEAELGKSWAAKINWASMLKGDAKHPVPEYLQGKTINSHPKILVLAEKPAPSPEATVKLPSTPTEKPKEAESKPAAAAPAEAPATQAKAAAPSPEPDEDVSADDEELVLEEDPTPQHPSSLPPSSSAPATHSYKSYAIFRANTLTITKEVVYSWYSALEIAYVEGLKQGKIREMVPIEIRDCYDTVCYSAKELYVSHPEELGRKFRELNLGSGDYEMRDF